MAKRILKEAIDRFYDYDIMLNTRTLYIGGEEIDQSVAEKAIKGLHLLDVTGESPINVILNSEGGEVYHGLAIYDAIKACKCTVIVTVLGCAMSMASIILQAADHRIVGASSRIMIHHGSMGMKDHNKVFYKWADAHKQIDEWCVKLYLGKIREKHPDMNFSDVDALLNFDTFYTAEEAVKIGLADEVLGES